jgi:two-component system, sensor histidine kinase and response regulator
MKISLYTTNSITALHSIDSAYNGWLVLLSIIIACASSILTFQIVGLAKQPLVNNSVRRMAIVSGSVAFGTGVWGMHFIGMLALRLCTPVSFDLGITLLSGLPGLLTAWVVLRHLVDGKKPLVSGVVMGLGISAMHYLGPQPVFEKPMPLKMPSNW